MNLIDGFGMSICFVGVWIWVGWFVFNLVGVRFAGLQWFGVLFMFGCVCFLIFGFLVGWVPGIWLDVFEWCLVLFVVWIVGFVGLGLGWVWESCGFWV